MGKRTAAMAGKEKEVQPRTTRCYSKSADNVDEPGSPHSLQSMVQSDQSHYESIDNKIDGVRDDLSAIKDQLAAFTSNFAKLTQTISDLNLKVVSLQKENSEKDVQIRDLDDRVNYLEQLARNDELIITGLTIRPKTYAAAAAAADVNTPEGNTAADENATEPTEPDVTFTDHVVNFLTDHDIPVVKSDITACFTLNKKVASGKPRPIMLKLCNNNVKVNIQRHAKNLKDTDVFINENLTARNGLLAMEARKLKKQGRIEATWSRNGVIFVKRRKSDKAVVVKSLDDLRKI